MRIEAPTTSNVSYPGHVVHSGRMLHARHILACAIALVLVLAAPGQARQGPVTLEGIDSLLARGSYAQARTMLESWWSDLASGKDPSPSHQAHALFLRARLNTDPRTAQNDYLTLALAHPAAPEAPAALLALGQGLLATGELQRAATYLERLARDYPTSPLRPIALLWLARVHLAAEQPNAACSSARQGGAATRDGELVALLRAEEAAACGAAAKGTSDKPFAQTAERLPQTAASTPQRPFTLQVGAFRDVGGAASLAARLQKAGFETRIVTLPGNSLHRVRVGTFQTTAEASAMARKVRAAGFEVVVTTDVANERSTP